MPFLTRRREITEDARKRSRPARYSKLGSASNWLADMRSERWHLLGPSSTARSPVGSTVHADAEGSCARIKENVALSQNSTSTCRLYSEGVRVDGYDGRALQAVLRSRANGTGRAARELVDGSAAIDPVETLFSSRWCGFAAGSSGYSR